MPQTDEGIYSTANKIRKEFGDLIADCYIKCARDNRIILYPLWWDVEAVTYWTGTIRMPTHIVSMLGN